MDLAVDLDVRSDRVGSVYRSLRDAIRSGRLSAGDRLPSSRRLAVDLGVSRATVTAAYERLGAEGFLEGRVGSGTFVSAVAADPPRRGTGVLRPRGSWRWQPQPVSGAIEKPEIDFRTGIPDASLFPFDTWRRLLAAESRLQRDRPGAYADPAGLPRLRRALADVLAYGRGVRVDPADLLITQATQQSLDLVARVLLEPGDVVAVEDPGYPSARDLFASHGARVVPVPVDAEGIVVSAIPDRARLVHTTPSHQFPLGVAMSLTRRRALLAQAARHGQAIVEDDYDSEFRFTPRPLEPLHALDRDGRVIYIGSFSKSLLPSLRIGYLVAPASLHQALLAARQLNDGFGPLSLQGALARFLEEGLLARHLRTASRVYAERRELVSEGLRDLVDEPVVGTAGLHLSGFLSGADELAARARRAGIAVRGLREYAVADTRDGLVLGYGAVVTDAIRPGFARLHHLAARMR